MNINLDNYNLNNYDESEYNEGLKNNKFKDKIVYEKIKAVIKNNNISNKLNFLFILMYIIVKIFI